MWSSCSSVTAKKLAGHCPEEAVEDTRWRVVDYHSWQYVAILAFSYATFAASALSSDFWHFSWVSPAKYKQARPLKVTAAAPGFGTL